MILDVWLVTVAILITQVAAAVHFKKSYDDLIRRKCETQPSRSVFVEETFTCLIVSSRCYEDEMPIPLSNRKLKTLDRIALQKIGIDSNNEDVCIYEPCGRCDYEHVQMGHNCLSYSKKGGSCEWPSVPFVPHWDSDIREALAIVSMSNPDSALLGLGLTSSGSDDLLFSETAEQLDYLRWRPNNGDNNGNLRVFLWVANGQSDSAVGYMIKQEIDESEDVLLCVRPLTFNYVAQSPKPKSTTTSTTSTTTTTTTTTSTTTTTTTSTTLSPEQESAFARTLIVRGEKDYENQLLRSHYREGIHRYYVNFNNWVNAQYRANQPFLPEWSFGMTGFIVNGRIKKELGKYCQELVKMNVYYGQYGQTWETEITNNTLDTTSRYDYDGSFWCAPYKGYCGADFELVSFRREDRGWLDDNFFPSTNFQKNWMQSPGLPPWQKHINKRVCWIWAIQVIPGWDRGMGSRSVL